MSGFGGFCPLPLRLGGSAEEGLTAAQHARICADLVAARRSTPSAIINYTKSGATITVNWYSGPDGTYTADFPFTAASGGTGVTTFTFPTYFEDEYERSEPFAFRGATAGFQAAGGGDASATVTSANVVTVNTFDNAGTLTDGTGFVVLHGRAEYPEIGDYDGALDKLDSATEIIPYAWTWYQEYEGMLGSAFNSTLSGNVHAAKLALARCETGVQRAAEAMNANALPATCDAFLGEWVQILNVVLHGDEDRHTIRQRCGSKFEASRGNSRTDVDETVSSLLGDNFVGIYRQIGSDLATPPTITYWPGVNPGTSTYSLGGGAWFSERCHLVVEVTKPAGLPDADWLTLMNVDLYRELSTLLPAWTTFNWAVDIADGFELDVDELDFTGLTPS